MLHFIVTDKNAIYVNDTRITTRSTKWGIHNTLYEGYLKKENAFNILISLGYETAVRNIDDDEEYNFLSDKALKEYANFKELLK